MLTDLSCKALITESKRINKPLKKSDGRGLILHAFPNGNAFWYHQYRINGKPRQISYGPYPLFSLEQARINHAESYRLIYDGIDPIQVKDDEIKQAEKDASSIFKVVAINWHQHNISKWSPKLAARIMRRMEADLFPDLGHVSIAQIRRKQLLDVVRKIEARALEAAKRNTQYLIGIFRYARDEELIETNVALDLRSSLKPYHQGRFPSMEISHLPEFLKRLNGHIGGDADTKRDAIELLMLTLVRSNELLRMEWTEIDFNQSMWTIPAWKMKMKKEHLVPLSKQATAILRKRYDSNFANTNAYVSKYVFTSPQNHNKHICHNALNHTLLEMGYRDIHSPHGFRALGMGIAKEKLGYRHEVPDRQLSHVPSNEVDRSYDRAKFLDERRGMMQRLADYIDDQRLHGRKLIMQVKTRATCQFGTVMRLPYRQAV